MAGDMRLIAATIEISGELERINDYVKGIARITLMIGPEPLPQALDGLPLMALKTREMLKKALDAASRSDADLARSIPVEDDEVDALFNEVYRRIVAFVSDNPDKIELANQFEWSAHNLERAADRVTNICEVGSLYDHWRICRDGYRNRNATTAKVKNVQKESAFSMYWKFFRSQMAEGFVKNDLSKKWKAYSAGTRPSGYVHPMAIEAMAELGIDISKGKSKSVDELRKKKFDLVITVCDAAAEDCPVWLGEGRVEHISFPRIR